MLELEGWQQCVLAQQSGFSWVTQEGTRAWQSKDEQMVWGYIEPGQFLDEGSIAKLGKGAQGSKAFFFAIVGGYGSERELYQGMAKCSQQSSAKGPAGDFVYVINGPSMVPYLCVITDAQDGDYQVEIYGPDALAAGLFDIGHELPRGVATYGSTVQEIFETYTGATYGDHLPA